ncbi:hypothetical protein EMIT0324P_30801 [Pseudomonas chlororaphis]
MRPQAMHSNWVQELIGCIPACIPLDIMQLQATNYMERTSLPRAPNLKKTLKFKVFFFACRKVPQPLRARIL